MDALSFRPTKQKGGIEVSVSDSGIGIPEEEKGFVFGRYYKGHGFTKYKNNTGPGLAIAKKILDLHNSSLVLHSRENEAACFALELPLYQ